MSRIGGRAGWWKSPRPDLVRAPAGKRPGLLYLPLLLALACAAVLSACGIDDCMIAATFPMLCCDCEVTGP